MNESKVYKFLVGEGLDLGRMLKAQVVTKTLVHYVGGYEDKNPGTHWALPPAVCKSGGT